MSASSGVRLLSGLKQSRYSPQLVITDVDNTLYDFGAYFEAGLRGLVDSVCSILGRSEPDVVAELRDVFTRHGSIEYPFALEDFDDVRQRSDSERRQILNVTSRAFWDSAAPALKPYPGVLSTLQHLASDGVFVVAYTDAPIHEATRRLQALGVSRYLRGVVATDWFERRHPSSLALRLADMPGFARMPSRIKVVGRLSASERKPNPQTYAQIMSKFDMGPQWVTVVGDSPSRDLQPAAKLGMRTVWARYGRRSPEAEVLLQQVVPFKLPEIEVRQDEEAARFPAIDRFDEILAFLPTQQALPLRMA